MHPNQEARRAMLEMCYNSLRSDCKPGNKSPGLLAESNLRRTFPDDFDFHLEVLLRLGQIERSGYKLRITGTGILAVEAQAE